ncbi:MAG: flippase-like domain-containing protein [Alphaproteobacteria bacterium]|nr:flippase-like domain-containing protein [Alphaproteobacteria bacterium]
MAEKTGQTNGFEDELVTATVDRRRWPFFLKVAVSAILIGFLITTHDIAGAIANLGSIQAPWFFGGLLLLCLGICLAGLRWAGILAGIEINLRLREVFRMVLIGLFFNQALPSTIGGDAVRAWQIHRTVASVGLALRSVILDRLAGLAGLILLVAIVLPFLFRITASGVAHATILGLITAAAAVLGMVLVFDRLPLTSLFGRFHGFLVHLSGDARRLLLMSRRAFPVLGFSILIHVFSALAVFCLAQGFGIAVDIVECLVLVPPVVLLMLLPISLAGWGVREGAMIAALGFVDVPASEALLLSIAFGLAVLLTNLPGGAVWLFTRASHPIRERATE